MRKSALCILLSLFGLILLPVQGQFGTSMYPGYDTSTQQNLAEIERMIGLGDPQKVLDLINRVIAGVGYIQPLAKIFYTLAQTENNCELVVPYYQTIVKHWSDSAWAQQAVIDIVPILLMTGEQFGQEPAEDILSQAEKLLAPADDAGNIPERPEVLQAQALYQLTLLAHHLNEPEHVNTLQTHAAAALQQENQDVIELAEAFAKIRLQQEPIETVLRQWMQAFPQSNLMPFALFTLYKSTNDSAIRQESANRLFTAYPKSLETEMLQVYIQSGN